MFKLRGSFLNTGLKLSIFILLAAGLIWQLSGEKGVRAFQFTFEASAYNFMLLTVVVLLMPLNWGLEAAKWRKLIYSVQAISLRIAFEAVLSGVTLGLLTPNRIGEYGGRILYLKAGSRLKAIEPSLAGSVAQICVTVVFGTFACIEFIGRLYNPGPYLMLVLVSIALMLNLLIVLAFYRFKVFVDFVSKLHILRKLRQYTGAMKALSDADMSRVLGWSVLRYLTFTAQYLLLLEMYDVAISPIRSFGVLALVFFSQTLLPTFALVELLKRGSIALFFFSFFTSNEWGILAASSTIWAINLIIPALGGYVLLLRRNLFVKPFSNASFHNKTTELINDDSPADRELADRGYY